MESKKNPKYDLNNHRHLFFSVGMIISLSLVLVAFEWKSPIDPVIDDVGSHIISCQFDFNIEEELPYQPPSTSWNEDGSISVNQGWICQVELVDFVNEDSSFVFIAESMPSFKGSDEELKTFVDERIVYPKQAQKLGIEGRVFVQFIVEEDGSLSEFRVVKGVGAGLDEEALRVMKLLPNFIQAEQQGIPVRVRMIYPINFTLQ